MLYDDKVASGWIKEQILLNRHLWTITPIPAVLAGLLAWQWAITACWLATAVFMQSTHSLQQHQGDSNVLRNIAVQSLTGILLALLATGISGIPNTVFAFLIGVSVFELSVHARRHAQVEKAWDASQFYAFTIAFGVVSALTAALVLGH